MKRRRAAVAAGRGDPCAGTHSRARRRWVPALLCLASGPLAVQADTPLSLSCAVCHGAAPATAIPGLYDRPAANIAQALRAYRDGSRPGSAMPRLAAALTDAEIESLAQRFGADGRR